MGYTERREAFIEDKRERAEEALDDNPNFESYLESHGEHGLPIYTGLPDDHDIVPRIVSRRATFLQAEYDVDERFGVAIAAMEMGLPASWTAEELGVTKGTVSNYHDTVVEKFGAGIYAQPPFTDLEREIEEGWPDLRECPKCDDPSVVSVKEASLVFNNSGEVLDGTGEDDTHVCSSCGLGLQMQGLGGGDDDGS